MKRSAFLKNTALLSGGLLLREVSFADFFNDFPVVRTPLEQRKFSSPAIEAAIAEFQKNVANKELGWLFGNCFPNTLDTTVDFETHNG